MGKVATPVGMILCLLLCMLPGQSSSQTQEPQSPNESQRQRMEQLRKEQQQRAEEGRQRIIQQQEEFWRRIDEQARQRLQEDWPNLTEEEIQRRLESLQRNEEQHRQNIQRQREFWQRTTEQQEQLQQRMEEARRKSQEKQKAIRKAAEEYVDEVWQEVLGATPEQWKTVKPRLEKIRQLKDSPYVDVSIYWIAGSTGYREESLVESSDGARSVAKASGWFSVTTGAGSTSESYVRSGADGQERNTPVESGHHSFSYGVLTSGQYSATAKTAPVPEDTNRPAISGEVRRMGSERRRAFARGVIEFGVQFPGPVKKHVDDIALGWQWEQPSLERNPGALNDSEKACERLVDVFEMKYPDPEEVRQHVAALRQVRAQAQAQLQEARRQLREIITPEQEPKLILMGYLD